MLLWDKQHETHMVRKSTLKLATISNLVYIGPILNEIQPFWSFWMAVFLWQKTDPASNPTLKWPQKMTKKKWYQVSKYLSLRSLYTVFPQIIARGYFFFFRTKRGRLFHILFTGGRSFKSRGAGYESCYYGINNTRPIWSERAHWN